MKETDPLHGLVQRLRELSDAVTQGREVRDREFSMRVPAEPARDADLVLSTAADEIERGRRIAEDASKIIANMVAIIIGMYVLGPEGDHNGKPYRDIAGELKAAENAADVRAALGLPPTAGDPPNVPGF